MLILDDYRKDLELFRVHRYRSKRLNEYYADYGHDHLDPLIDPHVKAVLNAQGLSCEEAPRSIYRVDKFFEALSHYAPGKIPKLDTGDDVAKGIALAYKCFSRPYDRVRLSVLPFTPATIRLVTGNPGGSPGLTNYGCTKTESQVRALERGIETLRREKKPEPCLAFKRTQFNDKTRLIWGYPYSMTVVEGLIAWPLNQMFKGGCTPMAFAMPSGALGTKLRVASYHNEWAYSLDMSRFDATISSTLIHVAFKILRTWYDEDEVEPVTGVTVREIFRLVEKYFIYTPIVMPDGNIYYGKDHGVPSGSFFTQMVDSIVNVIVGGTISARFHLGVSRREIFVLGDDLMLWSSRKVDLDVISKYVNQRLGIKLHGSEKSRIYHYNEIIHYLGRDWNNGMPDLDEDEILKRMVYPESFRKYAKDPVEAERQLHMMLLSYAGTYRSAWRIAYNAIDPSGRNIHRGCANTDVQTYIYEGQRVELTPAFFSGLMRFLMREGLIGNPSDIPNTAMQYWL